MAKTALYIAGFYLVYFIFLSSDTIYGRNRAFLISAAIISFILPLINLPVIGNNNLFYFGKNLSEIFVIAEGGKSGTVTLNFPGQGIMLTIIRIYVIGALLFAFKFLFDIFSLVFLIAKHSADENNIIRFKGFNTAGFSALGYIFVSQSVSQDEEEEIIMHERNHLRRLHFYDILLIELIKILQWFNPAIYMFNRSLRAVHEYQADDGCLKSGMTVTRYQNLLITHLLKSRIFVTSNSFSNPSLIRKRMVMMSKSRSGPASSFKILLAVPVIFLVLSFISACESGIDSTGREGKVKKTELTPDAKAIPAGDEEVLVMAEEMPVYPGGDKGLMEFIYSNVKYPDAAKEKGIQGRVILRFAVMADGNVDKVTVIKGVDPELDKEALRVIKLLEKWTPAKMGGKPVNVWYSVPITFQLR
jgi:TonB family protein